MFSDSTLPSLIESGLSKNISHSNVHFKVAYIGNDTKKRIYNWDSIIDSYRDILLSNMLEIEFTDMEMEQYRFKPRSFCYDYHSDRELWSILLRLNNMLTCTDFTRKKFLTFGPNFMKILNEILTIEDERLLDSVIDAKTL